MKYLLPLVLLILTVSSCNNKVESLEDEVSSLKNRVNDLEDELAELDDIISSNIEFEKEMRCQEMLDRLKERWNNVVGCYYDSYRNTCIVRYTDDGEVVEAPIESMADAD